VKAQLAQGYLALREFVAPLLERVSTLEGLEYLFHRYGWVTPLDETTYPQVRDATGVVVPLAQFLAAADPIRERMESDPDAGPTGPEVAALLESSAAMFRALVSIGSGAGALGAPFDRAELWESVAQHVLDDLIDDYTRAHLPALYAVLRLWGVIRHDRTAPTEELRRPYVRILVDWGQLLAILDNPATALANTYHWGDPAQPFAYEYALDSLLHVLRAVRVPASKFIPALAHGPAFANETEVGVARDAEALRSVFRVVISRADRTMVKAGLDVLPALRPGESAPSGFILRPVLVGSAGTELPIGPFVLRWQTTASIGDAIGIALFPDDAKLVGGAASFGTSLELGMARTEPWLLLGNANKSRLELKGLSARFAVEGSVADPEVTFGISVEELALMFDPDGGGTTTGALGKEPRKFTATAGFEWSSKRGMHFTGGGGIAFGLTSPRSLGGVTLDEARLSLFVDGGGLRLAATVSGSFALGPVSASVADIGVSATVRARAGVSNPSLRDLELDLGFQPPAGIGLSMTTPAAKLGGFLKYERATGRYSGGIELRLVDRLDVTAIGLLDTKRPDGGPGFSFIVLVGMTFPNPIPIGFNIYLTGVGGLFGLHRGVDLERLQAGLRDGVVDHLLFPTDLVENMNSIVSDLGEVFPQRTGQFVIGPTAKLAWNMPALITAEVGLIIEAPNPLRIALVGSVAVCVPRPDAPILVVHADFVGALDLTAGMLSFDASLHDSHLGTGSFRFDFEGDVAFRASWGAYKELLTTVGGFHPDYHPAAELHLPALRRVSISLLKDNPRLTLSAYFALTTNTLQVGALLDFHFGVSGFDIVGILGFDALFQFRPFRFVTSVRAQLAVRAGGSTLFSINLELDLSGTSPWHVKGTASFKICWFISVKVHLDKTWAEDLVIEEVLTAVLPVILAELDRAENWTALAARGTTLQVRMRDGDPPGTPAALDPAGLLSVAQRAVPLGTMLDRFGASRPSDAQRVDVATVRIGTRGVELDDARDEFAPATFRDMSDADKLRAASFESRKSGVVLRDGGAATDYLLARPVTYERIVSDASGQQPIRRDQVAGIAAMFEHFVRGGAIGRSEGSRRAGRERQTNSVRDVGTVEMRFAVVTAADLRAANTASAALTREQAERRLRDLIEDGHDEAAFEIVPEHEMAS
jgi:hypothetical protein